MLKKGNFIKRHNFPQMLPASWHMKDGRTVAATTAGTGGKGGKNRKSY